MNENLLFTALIVIGVIATALGYTLSALRNRIQLDKLKEKYASLNEKLDQERTETNEKFSSVERVRHDLELTLSSFTLTDIPINDREKFAQVMLQPLQESLRSADLQVKRINREGDKAQQMFKKQVEILQAPEQVGRGNPKTITATLGDSESRRQWGLTTLKRVLETTYMTDHYRVCSNKGGEEEKEDKYLPPCLIELVGGKQIAIDINAPLEAYVTVCQTPDPSVRSWHMETHARKLRERIMAISSRAYLSRFEEPPELIIELIFNDHYLSSAMEADSEVVQLATNQSVVLATPSDLHTLLQAVSFSWQHQQFSQDASKLRETGIHLYRHFGTFIKLIAELGSELSGVVDSYQRAVNYFESEVSKAAAAQEGQQQDEKTQAPATTAKGESQGVKTSKKSA